MPSYSSPQNMITIITPITVSTIPVQKNIFADLAFFSASDTITIYILYFYYESCKFHPRATKYRETIPTRCSNKIRTDFPAALGHNCGCPPVSRRKFQSRTSSRSLAQGRSSQRRTRDFSCYVSLCTKINFSLYSSFTED